MVFQVRRFAWSFYRDPSDFMSNNTNVKLYNGHNYRVLNVEGFDRIVFGCPPGVVKDFARRGDELPSRYIIPIRTFVKGKNYFDFEFIVYSFLFMRSKKEKVTIYCTTDQRDRFNIILDETLYGPKFHQIIRSQFRKIATQSAFSEKKAQRFYAFLDKVAVDKVLLESFQGLLKSHAGERALLSGIQKHFVRLLGSNKWLEKNSDVDMVSILAKNYILCAQLKNEMDLFALTSEASREKFTHDVIDFQVFDENNSVVVEGKDDKARKLNVVQVSPSVFDVYIDGDEPKISHIDISKVDPEDVPVKIEEIKKPYMGATFLGVGSGFAANRKDSCLIVWTEGKGIMVDAFPDTNRQCLCYGISENDIRYVLLTHVHSDHDAGLVEKILQGERIKIISTQIIFDSFLRKVAAITRFPIDVIEGFIDFLEVEPCKTIKLPGFKSSYFTFDYSLHSIPSGRFVLTYKNKKTGAKKIISHSGDTKFDINKINAWYEKGVLTRKRRDAVLGFVWDANLIIHEVGGGILHTELSSLEAINRSLKKKTILVHQHEDPVPHPYFRFAAEGQVEAMIKARKNGSSSDLETVKHVPLFKGLQQNRLLDMLSYSEVVKYKPDEVVFLQNDFGDAFYIILDGFAEVVIDGKSCAIYEKGKFFGELAVSTPNPYRRATIRAKSQLTLLKVPKQYYGALDLPKIRDDFYKLTDYFSEIISPSLVASLAFGKIMDWRKNEVIIRQGAMDDDMYIILSGKVEVINDKRENLAFLSRGDVIGEVSCLKNVPRTATVLAHSDEVYAICLKKEEAMMVFKLFPSFYGTVYKKIKKIEASMSVKPKA